MLIVRKSQIEALRTQLRGRFERAMLAHLRESFPAKYAELGETVVRDLIDVGSAKAPRYGLVVERDVGSLIHFMFDADPEFDQRPELGWAVEALEEDLEPSEKLERLHSEWQKRRPAARDA
jgi:hypothetical protein